MQILTNMSKAELDYLTSQPTAKKMIEKNKMHAINIAKGDAEGAAEFVASRKQEKQEAALKISDEGRTALNKSLKVTTEDGTMSGKVAVNAGKIARKIAAAKTQAQLRAVMAEIKGDMQEVKAGIEKGWCNEAEMDKLDSLMSMAQNRMGQVEDREATPEEENEFALISLI